jgi:hypothetical protein
MTARASTQCWPSAHMWNTSLGIAVAVGSGCRAGTKIWEGRAPHEHPCCTHGKVAHPEHPLPSRHHHERKKTLHPQKEGSLSVLNNTQKSTVTAAAPTKQPGKWREAYSNTVEQTFDGFMVERSLFALKLNTTERGTALNLHYRFVRKYV